MPSHPVFTPENSALITGAASGIGLAVAISCRKHGMRLALVDNNIALLNEVYVSTFKKDANVKPYTMDVSSLEEWKDLRVKVEMDFGHVGLVMLNAGIAIISTNLFGVINGITTFLPSLRAQSTPTAIIITGSKQGITNPPSNPAYNCSKAAIKSLAESLSYDLRSTPTSVHLVPGWTYTGLVATGATGAKGEKPAGAWWPEQVAQFLEEKMGEDQFYVICPDNDVSEEVDRRRMEWAVGDVVEGRLPLSRWREKCRGEAEGWIAGKGEEGR